MILFYFQEAFRIFRRSSLATIITVTITTIAVILSTISIFVFFSASILSERIKRSIEINVYLADSLQTSAVENLKNKIQSIQNVLAVQYINKDEAVKVFLAETGQDFKTVIEQNPLPNSFIVKLKPQNLTESNIDGITDQFKLLNGVTDVVYDYKTVLRILSLLKSFEYVIYLLSTTLLLFATYLVYSNNKIQIFGNRNLYITMKLVGAQVRTMKIPLILNGVLIGLIASLICAFLFYITSELLTKVYININFTKQLPFFYILILLIGITLGFIGSFISSLKISQLINEK